MSSSEAQDAVVVGGGLAGLVATAEVADAGRRVVLVDQEPEASLGGQAFWSFGGLFLVDSPEQRWLRIYAAGEVAGFGGGGMHGYRALEGTFLGGCLFSGRTAGRAAAGSLR
jgi:predicted oxidoreductase